MSTLAGMPLHTQDAEQVPHSASTAMLVILAPQQGKAALEVAAWQGRSAALQSICSMSDMVIHECRDEEVAVVVSILRNRTGLKTLLVPDVVLQPFTEVWEPR